MPRSIKEPCPNRPSHAEAWPKSHYETLDLQIQVVTPMFGGGAEVGQPDPVTLIRPSSIRGHLRFWWRATRGAECKTVEELKRREVEIFGDTEHPSSVTVRVVPIGQPQRQPCAAYVWNPKARKGQGGYSLRWSDSLPGNGLPYALFPFQGKPPKRPVQGEVPEKLPGFMTIPFSCQLIATFPRTLIPDLQAALWSWINFGGIGSRSRRGCGSLMCKDFSPASCLPDVLRQWIQDSRKHVSSLGTQPQFPVGFGRLMFSASQLQPVQAWDQAVAVLRDFRQGAGIGRNGTQGRSFWPEPETIRRLTAQRLSKHQRQTEIPNDGFPRAEFGLPIVFHFKDGAKNLNQRNVDPIDTELYPVFEGERKSRMASPLIIKALASADGKAVPLIVALRTPGLEQVELVNDRQGIDGSAQCAIRGGSFATYDKSPMKERSQSGSAIDAFLLFAEHGRDFKRLPAEVQS